MWLIVCRISNYSKTQWSSASQTTGYTAVGTQKYIFRRHMYFNFMRAIPSCGDAPNNEIPHLCPYGRPISSRALVVQYFRERLVQESSWHHLKHMWSQPPAKGTPLHELGHKARTCWVLDLADVLVALACMVHYPTTDPHQEPGLEPIPIHAS